MKTCPKCSTGNEDGQKFCVSCGSELVGDLERFLIEHCLEDHLDLFLGNDLHTLDQLSHLKDTDLDDLGLPLGDKIKLRRAMDSLIRVGENIPDVPDVVDQSANGKAAGDPVVSQSTPQASLEGGSSSKINRHIIIIVMVAAVALGLICVFGVIFGVSREDQKRKIQQVADQAETENKIKLASQKTDADAREREAKEALALAEREKQMALLKARQSVTEARLLREKSEAEERARKAQQVAAQAEREKQEALQRSQSLQYQIKPQPNSVPAMSASGPWIFADSSTRQLMDDELSGLSADQLWRARNEIYARHGYIFQKARGQAYARTLGSYYHPVTADQDAVFSGMNSIEQVNIGLIKKIESGR